MKLEFVADQQNKSTITNPGAMLQILNMQDFVQGELTEDAQCQILDDILSKIVMNSPNNSLALTQLLKQPIELLKININALQKMAD